MSRNTSLRITAVALGLGMGSFAVQTWSQGTPAGGYQMAPPAAPAPAPRTTQRGPNMRDIFAATLAAVVQTTGVAAANAVSTGLNGAITGWLDKKQRKAGGAMTYYPAQPASGYPGEQPGAPPPQSYPGTPGDPNTGYPSTGYPSTGYPDTGGGAGNGTPGYPGTGYPGTTPSDGSYPSTGYPDTGGTTPGYPAVPNSGYPGVPGSEQLYAGFAYEIHALGAGGYAQPVDPTKHAFRTGDRFKVVYRPSLPGQVDVYNTNAAGQTSQIDSLPVAAGQLAELGPYEFANMKGNETLILSISPCSTAALMTATRDIVKVPNGASPTTGSFELSQCGSPATRGLSKAKTRDIKKVSVEGGTIFGLDPLSRNEITSGDVAPRQITISLQHQ